MARSFARLTSPVPAEPTPRRGAIDYPESDGKPMAETDAHYRAVVGTRSMLERHFATDSTVYVGASMLLHYVEGDPRRVVAPDVFVVKGVPKGSRRTYQVWVEGVTPSWVLEVTSRGTRREDQGAKRDLYARLGVAEYMLFDPLGE